MVSACNLSCNHASMLSQLLKVIDALDRDVDDTELCFVKSTKPVQDEARMNLSERIKEWMYGYKPSGQYNSAP